MEDSPQQFVRRVYEHQGCHSCYRLLHQINNPFYVATLQTGDVMIGEIQPDLFEGYTVFVSSNHVRKPTNLASFKRCLYNDEIDFLNDAIEEVFEPKHGTWVEGSDSDGHMHTHIYPRHQERLPPIIRFDRIIGGAENANYDTIEQYIPTSKKLRDLRIRLLEKLRTQPVEILRVFN